MKKLLLIAMLALGVVACDKNELGDMDHSSINKIEAPVADALDMDLIVSNLLKAWTAGELNSKATKGNATHTSKSDDYVVGHVFVQDGQVYLTLLDESNDDLCFGEITATPVYLDNVNGDGSAIAVEQADGSVTLTINGNFSNLFSANNNNLFTLDGALEVSGGVLFDDDNYAEFN